MNLIEQQSAAKDLPMQYLQQAVNGQNPNLTPWIATAELQRRTTMNQHMAPKGPQGPQPTVKDQVEQKAGLMATQAAQQAQAAQAQQSLPPPGPIPGGIPQPEVQSEEPVMAARGGLMNAPVNFKFAHGGILGYADGGETANTNTPETYVDENGVRRFTATNQPVQPAQPARAPQGLRANVDQYANEPTKSRTLEDIIAETRAIQAAAGTDQPMGVDEAAQRASQDEVQRRRNEQAQRLARAAGVAASVGTPGSESLAYNKSLADSLEQEGTYGQTQYKNIAELAAAKRAAAEKQQTALETPTAAGRLASATERYNKAGIGERLVSVDAQTANERMRDLTTRYTSEQQNKSQEKIAALSRAMQGSQFNRQEARDAANQLNQMGQRAEADVNNLRAQFLAAQKAMEPDEIERIRPLLTNAEAVQRSVVAAIGKSAGVAMPAPAAKTLSAPDQQALNWANSNPKDPRAAQIKQRLGM
jgi:hypothetical protein